MLIAVTIYQGEKIIWDSHISGGLIPAPGDSISIDGKTHQVTHRRWLFSLGTINGVEIAVS